jgi:hypothetical protein
MPDASVPDARANAPIQVVKLRACKLFPRRFPSIGSGANFTSSSCLILHFAECD